tara:strand:+ start:232 stop:735 length:504 start_codon:yes stop_codon:yes gene_type:complete
MNLINYVKKRSEEIGDCWEWTGALQQCGTTPTMRYQQQTISVRRLLLMGQGLDVAGKVATSSCGNKLCVNPDHLELITRKRLTKRIAANFANSISLMRKAHISISMRQRSKLTAALADEIRQSDGKQRDIAKRYGVSQTTVNGIKNGRTWRDYLNPFAQLIGAKKND